MLVIEVHETDVGKLRQIINLFMNHLFARLIALSADAPAGRLPYPCSLFLDEFASAVGKIDDMEVRLNTVRERGVSVVAAVQSLSQLAVYGTAAPQVLAGFASKVYFAGLEWSDAEYASRQAGVTTVDAACPDERGLDGGPPAPVARAVLLPEEVARPVVHPTFGPPATLFLADVPPVQVYLRPAYDLPLMARFLDEEAAAEGPDARAWREVARPKRELGWEEVSADGRAWWQRFEQGRAVEEVLALLAGLAPLREAWGRLGEAGALLDGFVASVAECAARQPRAQLAFFHYRLLERQEERERDERVC
jgi:hypothetical protein